MFLEKKDRHGIIILNVVPLIDISAMIIIFLVLGSIFSESSIVIPRDVFLPTSDNKEDLVQAPQISVSKESGVELNIFNKITVPLKDFSEERESSALQQLKARIKEYISKLSEDQKKQGILVNFIADKATPYKEVFDVIKFFRESGFQSILFVAQGK